MLASAELVGAAELEEARSDTVCEVETCSSEDVTKADGREDAVTVGVCDWSEELSS